MKVLFALLASLLAFTGVYAGHNCKCQIGGNGSPQDDHASELCCLIQIDNGGFFNQIGGIAFHPDQHHQCSSSLNSIDSGKFVQCCKDRGVGGIGAFCWD